MQLGLHFPRWQCRDLSMVFRDILYRLGSSTTVLVDALLREGVDE